MSYRIVYGPMPKVETSEKGSIIRLQIMTAAFVLLFAILVRIIWPEGSVVLQSMLLPNEAGIAESAFTDMISDIQQGDAMGDAITSFCKQVIDSAEVLH